MAVFHILCSSIIFLAALAVKFGYFKNANENLRLFISENAVKLGAVVFMIGIISLLILCILIALSYLLTKAKM